MKRVKLVLADENVLFPFADRCVFCGKRQSVFRVCLCSVN